MVHEEKLKLTDWTEIEASHDKRCSGRVGILLRYKAFIHFYQPLNTSKVVKPGEHDSAGLSYYKLVASLLGAGRLPVRAE